MLRGSPHLCESSVKDICTLPYWIDDVEHQCDQPGQNQYADDDRIDIAMDVLEYVHLTSLSSACAGGCCTSASFTACWASMSRRRGQMSFTRPIWANRTMNATPVTASQIRWIPWPASNRP